MHLHHEQWDITVELSLLCGFDWSSHILSIAWLAEIASRKHAATEIPTAGAAIWGGLSRHDWRGLLVWSSSSFDAVSSFRLTHLGFGTSVTAGRHGQICGE